MLPGQLQQRFKTWLIVFDEKQFAVLHNLLRSDLVGFDKLSSLPRFQLQDFENIGSRAPVLDLYHSCQSKQPFNAFEFRKGPAP